MNVLVCTLPKTGEPHTPDLVILYARMSIETLFWAPSQFVANENTVLRIFMWL